MKKTTWMVGAAVLALAAGGGWWWTQRSSADAVQYRTAKIERGPLSGHGVGQRRGQPGHPGVGGHAGVGADQGAVCGLQQRGQGRAADCQIDPETFEYRVRQAQADVDAARAAVLTAEANAATSRAGVSRAQSDLTEANRTYERNVSLQAQSFISQAEVDRTRAVVATASESSNLRRPRWACQRRRSKALRPAWPSATQRWHRHASTCAHPHHLAGQWHCDQACH
jgi:HlyD family secretion protein